MSISDGCDDVQRQVRAETKAAKREAQSGIQDMFGPATFVDQTAGRGDEAAIDDYWERYLQAGPRRIGVAEFADILEDTDYFPSDLQSSLLRLIASGRVRNLEAKGKRKKRPLHFEENGGRGEHLEWIPQPVETYAFSEIER